MTRRDFLALSAGATGVPMPWIATKDIGAYPATRLTASDFSGSSIQELHGQRNILMNGAASVVGKAIGKPDVSYVQVPSSMLLDTLLMVLPPAGKARVLGYLFHVRQAPSQTVCLVLIDALLVGLIVFDRSRRLAVRPYILALLAYIVIEASWLTLGRPI